jgi:flagellar biosynthesis/type III secretory pathway protein FliH
VKSSPNLIKIAEKEEVVRPWHPEIIAGNVETLVGLGRGKKGFDQQPQTSLDHNESTSEDLLDQNRIPITKNLLTSHPKTGNVHQWAPPNLYAEANQYTSSKLNVQNPEIEKTNFTSEKDWSKKLAEIRTQAEDIINSTRKKVMEMIREAESRVDQIHGLARMEGMEEGKKEATELMTQVGAIVNETQSWRNQVLGESESVIIEIIQSIAKKLFGNGFILEPATVEQMVARAISEASRLGNLRVYLNPEDQVSLISLWQDSELTVNGQKIQLVPSQNILRGGCFVEGEFGSVDSRADIQLNLINDELSAVVRNEVKEGNE